MKKIYLSFILFTVFYQSISFVVRANTVLSTTSNAKQITYATESNAQNKKPTLILFYNENLLKNSTPSTVNRNLYSIEEREEIIFATVKTNLTSKDSIIQEAENKNIATSSFAEREKEQEIQNAVKVLKLIKAQVTSYGGDEKNITICGEGPAGSLVSLLAVTKEAKGLFQKAIVNMPDQNLLINDAKSLPDIYEEYEKGKASGIKLIITTSSNDEENLLQLPALQIAYRQSKWGEVYFLNFENTQKAPYSKLAYILNAKYLSKRQEEIATKSELKALSTKNLQLGTAISERYMNFIKTGNPSKLWKKFTGENSEIITENMLK